MRFGRLAIVVLITSLVPVLAAADALGGAIFAQSVTVQTNTRLVLNFVGGGSFTLNTADSAIQDCVPPVNCKDPGGNPVAKAPNQGAWSTVDVGNLTGNSIYLAGTTSGFTFRDFWSFDLAKYKEYLASHPGLAIESAILEVERYGYVGGDYVGIRFNPVSGLVSAGAPIMAYGLTDLSSFDANYFGALGGPSNGAAGLYGTYKLWNTDPAADPSDILLFNLTGAGSPLIADLLGALGNQNDNQGHNFFTIGGSTFDASSTDGVPIVPTSTPQVPEPASLVLIASGLAGVWARRKS